MTSSTERVIPSSRQLKSLAGLRPLVGFQSRIFCKSSSAININSLKQVILSFGKLVPYLTNLLVASPVGIDDSLRELLARRDGSRCCVTPESYKHIQAPEATHIISPSLLRICDSSNSNALLSFLGAFLTPANSLRLREMLSGRFGTNRLSNLLLLSPSLSHGLRNGHVKLLPMPALDWNEVDDADRLKLSTAQVSWAGFLCTRPLLVIYLVFPCLRRAGGLF